jgi:hypothetical protein
MVVVISSLTRTVSDLRYIEIIIENQELDNVMKLQLVQPLSFGDNGIMLSQKNQAADTWTLLQVSQI